MRKDDFVVSVSFAQSRTKENLLRAFAGESQARNRYTFAASQAKEQKLHVVERVFAFTADQEKEHGEIFYKLLSQATGENIHIDGAYPVDLAPRMAELLAMAHHNEMEEHEVVYPAFAQTAREEGFTAIGDTFAHIAAIEQLHAMRFKQYEEMLKSSTLFNSPMPCAWLCLNCGHIHWGAEAPTACPVCHHDQGYFIRTSLAPFLVSPPQR